ncbi:MAG: acetyl-CoA carboxylase biotin carboxyl carrier protein [Isosphaeraceae bacterium]|nr:acetyl-CoA carboxylase biotin carboxyl carrier protein [Isosphaeraceae bacterium]
MSENPSEPLDVRTIHHLVRLMKRYDLTAIDFTGGTTKIRLRRQGAQLPSAHFGAPVAPLSAAPSSAPAVPQAPAAPVAAPAAPAGIVIESPMVGTYYSSGSPDVPAFVSVGSAVRPDSTVCIIEAMKVFTDIPAGVSGTITEVLVKNGQAVEYGQALFRVNPA